MRKYYALFFVLVAVWTTSVLTIPTKNFIGQSLQKVEGFSYSYSESFLEFINPYRLLIFSPARETLHTSYTNSLAFYLPPMINSKNFEITVSFKTVCS